MSPVSQISKSLYCAYGECPRRAWLKMYKPEEEDKTSGASQCAAGIEVGIFARNLFPGGFDATVKGEDGRNDCKAMAEATAAAMQDPGIPAIYEASFMHGGLYAAIDNLVRDGDGGWEMYEVKSKSSLDEEAEEKYIEDIAFQLFVLELCGVRVNGAHLVFINGSYVKNGDIDVSQLFSVQDVTSQARSKQAEVASRIAAMRSYLSSRTEPECPLSKPCLKPEDCPFLGHCTNAGDRDSVFHLRGANYKNKCEWYNSGIATLQDLAASGAKLTPVRLRQVLYAQNPELPPHADIPKLSELLELCGDFPCFLDFETENSAIPIYDGTSPYQQVPTQYSLHIAQRDGTFAHREFLGTPERDPRRELAESLCKDVPAQAKVLVYNKRFETSRLCELAGEFEDLSAELLDICSRIVDLMLAFTGGAYYNSAMGGSFSIKSVAPALFPGCPELDYHALEDVHNGQEATDAFLSLSRLRGEERERLRKNLLLYCEKDTWSLVKIWMFLRDVVSGRAEAA